MFVVNCCLFLIVAVLTYLSFSLLRYNYYFFKKSALSEDAQVVGAYPLNPNRVSITDAIIFPLIKVESALCQRFGFLPLE